MKIYLATVIIAASLTLLGGGAHAMTDDTALALAGAVISQKDAAALAELQAEAQSGDAAAEGVLGWMYESGVGVARDDAQALAWYRKAADQNNADALNNLGVMYDKGQGVPQDSVIAYALLNISATADSSSDNPATVNREQLSQQMTEPQIADGQALTRRMLSIGILKAIASMP